MMMIMMSLLIYTNCVVVAYEEAYWCEAWEQMCLSKQASPSAVPFP